jgi:altronate hydrolase
MAELHRFRSRALQVSPEDNVAVALDDLTAGEAVVIGEHRLVLRSPVRSKHKFALKDLAPGAPILMYGVTVGEAADAVKQGEPVTPSNLRHRSAAVAAKAGEYAWRAPDVARWKDRTFLGYHRPDGQVGTRNYWIVIPLVFCENRNIQILQEAFEKELGISRPSPYQRHVADLVQLYRTGKVADIAHWEFKQSETGAAPALFPNLDGIKFLTHQMGCGGTRQDARALCGLLAGYLHNPNVAGATVLSLGCQNAQASILREEIQKRDAHSCKPLLVFDQQGSELESVMLPKAIRETFLALIKANEAVRTPAPLCKLTVGLKCGGSDGFSGITANPVLGYVSDRISALGGKTILSEFPELCGVEQDLVNRCQNDELAERFLKLMSTYSDAAEAVGSGFDKNPSPGNIRDGLITGAMKSAGAARKGGRSPVTGVLDYPEYAESAGLNLLCTPGNDLESVTAQVGAGANLVLFTTGLGTPTGNPIAPVVKVSTNSQLAARMHDIIDVDCGTILTQGQALEQAGDALVNTMIRVASGEIRTKAELKHQDDFIPWKRGVSL